MKCTARFAAAFAAALLFAAPAFAQKVLRSQTVSFDNITAIEAVPFARFDAGAAIILSGDLRAGVFIKDAVDHSVATGDGLAADTQKCVFIPSPQDTTGASGGWVRKSWIERPGYVLVSWCGATGDGSTDDKAAIQAALTFGDYIEFPEGTFRTSAALTKTGEDYTIEGAGYGRTIIEPDAGTFNVFEFDDGGSSIFNVNIRDFSIIFAGNKTAGAFMIFNDRLIDSTIERLHIDGYYDGITVEAPGRVFFNRIIAEQTSRTAGKANFTFNLIDDAVLTGKATDVHFTDVQARGWATASTSGLAHIRINTMDGVYINNSHFGGFDYALRFDPNNTGDQDTIASLHVANSYFDTAYAAHVIWIGTATTARGFYFTNNQFRDSKGTAGSLYVGENISRLSVIGGTIRDNARAGLITPGTDTLTDATISGVQFVNNNGDNNSAYGDILVKVVGGNFSNNDFIGGGALGTAVTLSTGSSNARIIANGFEKSTAGTLITDNGTGTRKAINDGYVTEASGSTGVTTDANGEATIAHGLSGTPTFATASYFADSTSEIEVIAVDGTNLTVRLRNTTTNADTTSASVTIRWYARL